MNNIKPKIHEYLEYLKEYRKGENLYIKDLKFEGIEFKGLDFFSFFEERALGNVYFEGCTFERVCFFRGTFDYGKFTNCKFINCNFDEIIGSNQLNLYKCTFTTCTFANSEFISNFSFICTTLKKCYFSYGCAHNLDFEECVLNECLFSLTMDKLILSETTLNSCTFDEAILTNFDASTSKFDKCAFNNVKFVKASFTRNKYKGNEVKNSIIVGLDAFESSKVNFFEGFTKI